MSELVQSAFDYSELAPVDAIEVRMAAERIRMRMKRTAEDIIAIGEDLAVVKVRLPHGQFGDWLKAEFEMSEWTARNFMNVTERFGNKTGIIPDLSPTILYQLAAPSTPDEITNAVLNGEIEPTSKAVKQEIVVQKALTDIEIANLPIVQEIRQSREILLSNLEKANQDKRDLEHEVDQLQDLLTQAQSKKAAPSEDMLRDLHAKQQEFADVRAHVKELQKLRDEESKRILAECDKYKQEAAHAKKAEETAKGRFDTAKEENNRLREENRKLKQDNFIKDSELQSISEERRLSAEVVKVRERTMQTMKGLRYSLSSDIRYALTPEQIAMLDDETLSLVKDVQRLLHQYYTVLQAYHEHQYISDDHSGDSQLVSTED